MKRITISDVHIPSHDWKATAVALKIIEDQKPDVIDLLGDIIDCAAISRFDKDPTRKALLQDELDEAVLFLECVRAAAPKAHIIFSEGNHEDRLRKYKWTVSPELASLRALDLPDMLQLSRLGIEFKRYDEPYLVGDLWYCHGHKIKGPSGQTGLHHAASIGGSVMVGHCHRLGMTWVNNWGKSIKAYENGCLCLQNPTYVKGPPNWQQGMSIVNFYEGCHVTDLIQIINGKAIYHGYTYGA